MAVISACMENAERHHEPQSHRLAFHRALAQRFAPPNNWVMLADPYLKMPVSPTE